MDQMDSEDGGEELSALATRLFAEGRRMMSLKPADEAMGSMHGMPAVMAALARAEGPLSPGDLARRMRVSDARVASILRVLAERGYIERRAGATDRRRVEVVLTQAGREDERRRGEHARRFAMEFLDELGIEDARELVRVLGRVNDVMEARRAEGRQFGFHEREYGRGEQA